MISPTTNYQPPTTSHQLPATRHPSPTARHAQPMRIDGRSAEPHHARAATIKACAASDARGRCAASAATGARAERGDASSTRGPLGRAACAEQPHLPRRSKSPGGIGGGSGEARPCGHRAGRCGDGWRSRPRACRRARPHRSGRGAQHAPGAGNPHVAVHRVVSGRSRWSVPARVPHARALRQRSSVMGCALPAAQPSASRDWCGWPGCGMWGSVAGRAGFGVQDRPRRGARIRARRWA